MNGQLISLTSVCVFLLTYLLHSTLAVAVFGSIAHRLHRRASPELRVLVWKMVLLLPLVTTIAVSIFDTPHCGFQFSVASSTSTSHQDASNESQIGTARLSPTLNRDSFSNVDFARRVSEQEPENRLSEAISLNVSPLPSGASSKASNVWLMIVATWLAGVVVCLLGLTAQMWRLGQLRKQASVVHSHDLRDSLNRIKERLHIRGSVAFLQSPTLAGPLTAGVFRPFVLVPSDIGQLPMDQRDAMLAHELVHIARGDAIWNMIIQIVSRVFFFQPLNAIASQRLRKEMDFVADSCAAQVRGERTGLAHCLIRLGDRFASAPKSSGSFGLASGMASFRSTLGQRIEALLDVDNDLRRLSHGRQIAAVTLMVSGAFLVTSIVPRAVAQHPLKPLNDSISPPRNATMKMHLAALTILTGFAAPLTADEPQEKPAAAVSKAPLVSKPLTPTQDDLPKGVAKFNGMLVGRLVSKDVERETFLVKVDAVSRVWENSKAENPQSLVGKTIAVNGVFGKFLDVLVVTRTGETVEFECKHDGDKLIFPGELLRKVAPYTPEDYPTLPEDFRGFQGAVVAEIVKKDPESFELIVKVLKVSDTWEKSTAKQASSIEGKSMMLAGFWNRKEAYHNLKVGERIDVGMKHIALRSDHVTVAEFVRESGDDSDRASMQPDGESRKRESVVEEGSTPELRGFRGMLVGRLVEKDIERGTFTLTVEAVPRVWEKNQASNPKTIIGKEIEVGGVSGKMLDALVVARVGETIEFGAMHDGGDRLRVGESLRKVSPVQPGSYPEIPSDFRGFKGMVVGKIVKKDEHLMELTLEISEIKNSFNASRAKDANSILGRQVMLSGFWQRKDAFHSVQVGDVIETGVDHKQPLSDQLTVVESVKKVDKK